MRNTAFFHSMLFVGLSAVGCAQPPKPVAAPTAVCPKSSLVEIARTPAPAPRNPHEVTFDLSPEKATCVFWNPVQDPGAEHMLALFDLRGAIVLIGITLDAPNARILIERFRRGGATAPGGLGEAGWKALCGGQLPGEDSPPSLLHVL